MTDNEALYQLKVKQLNLSQLENEALITNNYLALRVLELYDKEVEDGNRLAEHYDDLNSELYEMKVKLQQLENEIEILEKGE